MFAMSGYGAREVAKMLGLSEGQVRSWVRAGFLDPSRGPRGELRFSFQDLVLLRTAQGLVSARIPPRRVRSALRKLKGQLPGGRPLRAVHIRAEGDKIVVGDGDAQWSPESGQVLFDFGARELARKVAPLHLRSREPSATAADWYERACDLEESAPGAAQEAYRRALALDPDLADAHVNLGRLVHEAGHPRPDEAILAYRTALAADAGCADAHYNLASLYEQRGDGAAALRHLRTYRKLVQA